MLTSHSAVPRSVLVLGLLAFTAAACSSGGGGAYSSAPQDSATVTPPAAAKPAVVSLKTVGKLGPILVDGSGRTLYLFLKDSGSASSCAGACAQLWPPLTTAGAPTGATGVTGTLLGTTARADGSTQVTYHGHPLYYYAPDTQPGQATGQALNQFGAKWYVLSAKGDKVTNGGS
jgi:predicted lipoprotein with Yx(FWY)xxD motif